MIQLAHGKAQCGCEWIHGTVVDMCEVHIAEMDAHFDKLNEGMDEDGKLPTTSSK